VLYSFDQAREDLDKHLPGLTTDQIWREVGGASVGFHLKHIAGSVDRLTTYLTGEQVTEAQMTVLRGEAQGQDDFATLMTGVRASLDQAERKLRDIRPETLYDARSVGRRALPTTVIGLLVHIAEHTQRHVGQAITLSKVLRQMS
jgi:uncharacterized damage-inducible protein DinB